MRNTLLEGDNLFVNKAYYGMRLPFIKENFVNFHDVNRGDIIIFRFPAKDREQSHKVSVHGRNHSSNSRDACSAV